MGLSAFLGKWAWISRSAATPRPWLRLSGHTWKNTISISSGRIPFLRIAWPPSNRTLMYEHSSTWICTGAPSIHQKTSSWRPSIEWRSQTPSSSVGLHQQLPLASYSRRSFTGMMCQSVRSEVIASPLPAIVNVRVVARHVEPGFVALGASNHIGNPNTRADHTRLVDLHVLALVAMLGLHCLTSSSIRLRS